VRATALVAAATILLPLAGCGSDDQEPPATREPELGTERAPSATKQPDTSAAEVPVTTQEHPAPPADSTVLEGTYTVDLPELPAPRGGGSYELRFAGRDAFLTPAAAQTAPLGNPIAVSGDRVTFGIDEACAGPPSKGTYRFALRGDRLALTKIRDGCDERALVLTSAPWRRR
jgi:hypothetical protein